MNIETLRDYIKQEILNDDTLEIQAQDDLLLSGLLDSLGMTRLLGHIQDVRQQVIPPEDVTLENFGSLQKIEDYLGRERPAGPGDG